MAKKKKLIKGPWSWTKEDIRLLKRLYPKGNIKNLAERLNRPLTAVRQKAYDIGMKSDVYNYWTKEDLRLLRKLYANTVTAEIATRLKRSAGSVKTKARQLGLKKSQRFLKAIKSRPRKRRTKK
jgi:methylphosphotriester-DNA--protein-cysteine methyltransferase